ncbi:arsenate reductase/protein-tyrosine-phosphatase family protein [Geodermatophilus amargosae]|uniref:arsenate reductase/protein-tyrosine-phosphatase family protein n=1 Tax=Geodermatophilus amargosae TaxID=1296565 RepID=UPI0034DF9C0B
MSALPQGDLLVVCTGNICRSPAAELLLRAGLGAAGPAVASAGLAARTGEPVAPPMAALLTARGVDPGGFAARQLQPPMLRSAGLVLTMTAAQRSAVVTRAPAVVRRTFTLLEFADLARLGADLPQERDPAGRLATLLTAAPRLRALRTGPRDDDVEDPHGLGADVFARSLARIEAATALLLEVLTAHVARSASPSAGRLPS